MINELNKLLSRCDLLMRPYALVIAPENKEQILKEMPHLQDKMKIIVCGLVEKDKCYLISHHFVIHIVRGLIHALQNTSYQ